MSGRVDCAVCGLLQTHEDAGDDTRDAPDEAGDNGDGKRNPVAAEHTRSNRAAHKKDGREADEVPEHERHKDLVEVGQRRRERHQLAKRPVHLIFRSERWTDNTSQSIHDPQDENKKKNTARPRV